MSIDPTEAKQQQDFRDFRALILAKTDHLVSVQDDTRDKTLLLEFRQLLRDVPQTRGDFAYRLEPETDREREAFAYGTQILAELGLIHS
jgi:hypothetical protein|tara:strand:- start:2679 stop:2945 length:267 start_codon:yes stop_codon:yes gene_type:complete